MKSEKLTEKWFTLIRFYCKEGHIDMWSGDCGHDPNEDTKPSFNLNHSITCFRLNGEGEWIDKNELKGLFEDINTYDTLFTSNEYWDMAQVNCIRRATGKDKAFCKELYRVHGDFRIAIEHYRSNSGWSVS